MKILKLSQANGEIVLSDQELAEGKILIEVKAEDFKKGPVKFSIDSDARIKKEKAEAEAAAEAERRRLPRVSGHPNCYWGDCDDCQDVACAIHQGYEQEYPDYSELYNNGV